MPPINMSITSSCGISHGVDLEIIEKYQSEFVYWIIPKGATIEVNGSFWTLTGAYMRDIKYIELD